MRLMTDEFSDAVAWIPNRNLRVSKVLSTTRTEMPTVWMNTEVVPIKVRMRTIRTRHMLHGKAKDGTDHVVDGVQIGDY